MACRRTVPLLVVVMIRIRNSRRRRHLHISCCRLSVFDERPKRGGRSVIGICSTRKRMHFPYQARRFLASIRHLCHLFSTRLQLCSAVMDAAGVRLSFVFLIERAAYPWFGTRGYGVHINGYVKDESSAFPKLWLAVRSKTKQTWPGMLDHIVAGAQPHGISVVENVVKECEEEASIPRELAEKAVPSSCVSYTSLDEQGRLKRDAIFVFDLQLPKDFEPTPCDGEVDRFYLRDLDWVLDKLVTGGPEVVAKSPEDGFKPNCNLVVMDFLARQGYLSPDSPKYLELLGALRQAGCA
eukprot:TRINITY_DN25964_c0_g1_i4.p1 TRINITY_DN25964_c0_g1~~TRINITY_DN25964_c0_g1_i4.p1  ORF type:complete len:308 (-),score=24.28 TRINITY_DN25964_c0_g1_i4:451-1338(-)